MTWHYNSDRSAAVSDTFMWQSLTTCPLGVKVLLLTTGDVCVVGIFDNQAGYKNWSPLPRQERRSDVILREQMERMRILREMED
jgi:hypothetical protein